MNTLTDLKDALDEVSRERPPLPNLAAIAQTRGRRSFRLRLVAVATATLVVLGGSLGLMSLVESGPTNEAVPPLSSANPSERLPMYQEGYKLLASVEKSDPLGVDITFVVPDQEIALAKDGAAPDGRPRISFEFKGVERGWSSSTEMPDYLRGYEIGATALESSDYWPLTPGETITLRQEWDDGQAREGSLWAMGVYVKVPPDKYPFEGSPKAIQDVPAATFTGPCATIMQSSSRDRTFSCRLTLKSNELHWISWASVPGELRTTANGVPLGFEPLYAWHYGRQSPGSTSDLQSFDAKPGDTITLTAEWTPYTDHKSELGIIFFDNMDPPDSLCRSDSIFKLAPRICEGNVS